MPIYEFSPIDPKHSNWEASTFIGRCRVHAPDEARAGEFLHAEFGMGTTGRNPDGTIVTSPWKNLERVTCSEPAYDPMPEYREGLIEEYRSSGGAFGKAFGDAFGGAFGATPNGGKTSSWVPINEDRLPPQGNYGALVLPSVQMSGGDVQGNYGEMVLPSIKISGGDVPPGPSQGTGESASVVGGSAVVTPVPITEQTIRRVVQNQTVLKLQASALLASLDGLIGAEGVPPEQRNMSAVEALGLGQDVDESELLSLLRGLRDEIRGFREALEKAGSDPEKLEPSTLARLRDVGIDYLVALAKNKVFVSTTGAALGCMLWTQLAEAGLIDTSQGYKLLEMIVKALS